VTSSSSLIRTAGSWIADASRDAPDG